MGKRDASNGLKPDTLRKRRYHARIRARVEAAEAAIALGLAPDRAGEEELQENDGTILLDGLKSIAADEGAGAQARVMASRAVLEAQGVLGRHAPPPRDKAESLPPALLTRAGLVAELARLRAARTRKEAIPSAPEEP